MEARVKLWIEHCHMPSPYYNCMHVQCVFLAYGMDGHSVFFATPPPPRAPWVGELRGPWVGEFGRLVLRINPPPPRPWATAQAHLSGFEEVEMVS